MLLDDVLQPFSFAIASRGHHHGQADLTLVAYTANGDRVGYLDYATYQGEVHVQMIRAERRGIGIGPALVRRLQGEYPDTEIDFGMLTADGAKMLAKLPTVYLPNQEYSSKSKRLEQIKAQLADFQHSYDQFSTAPSAQRWVAAVSDAWNALNDEERELEQAMRELQPGTRLIR